MRFIESVLVTDYCLSVCHHTDQLYVGHYSGVDIVTPGKVSPLSLSSFNSLRVHCIRQHVDDLYLLCCSSTRSEWTLRVHSLDGKNLIRSWKHNDTNGSYHKFAIFQDIIYVPSVSQKKVISYSLSGSPAGEDIHVSLSNTRTSVCVTTSGLIVLTQDSPSVVIAFDLQTRGKLWSLHDPDRPQGVIHDTCSDHLLVYMGGNSTTVCMQVVDSKTGESR